MILSAPYGTNADELTAALPPGPTVDGAASSLPKLVINLPRRSDRWQAISERMTRAGLTDLIKVPAVEGARLPPTTIAGLTGLPAGDIDLPPRSHLSLTRPALGCFLSHLAVWRWVLASGHPRVLVFEDDAAPAPAFDITAFEATVADLPPEAGLVFVGRIIMAGLAERPSGRSLSRLHYFNGTFAYLITPAACEYLLEHLGPPEFHIDHQMSALLHDRRHEFPAYYTEPAFFEPDWSQRSDCYVPITDEADADRELEAIFAARRRVLIAEGRALLDP
jgi:glycosyl transferase family 25